MPVVRAPLFCDGDTDGTYVQAKARFLVAVSSLSSAIAVDHGELAAREVAAKFGLTVPDALAMAMAEWKIEGDRAEGDAGGSEALPHLAVFEESGK